MFESVGCFTEKILFLLGLNIEIGTKIFLSAATLEHIKRKHPEITGNLKKIIAEILANPNYIGYNLKKNTIDFISTDDKMCLRVPVRSSSDGIYFVRSMFMLHKRNFDRLVKNDSIKPFSLDTRI